MAAILKMAETRMVHAISYFITRQGNFMQILVLVLLIKIIYQLVAPLEEVRSDSIKKHPCLFSWFVLRSIEFFFVHIETLPSLEEMKQLERIT